MYDLANPKGKVAYVVRPDITREEVHSTYQSWAKVYDEDMPIAHRSGPQEALKTFLKFEIKKDIHILDLAAGTGLIGEHLTNNGYSSIDAYDASDEMLKVAAAKNIYRNISCQFIGREKSAGIDDETYDAIICVGAFYPGHLDETCLAEILRMLKTGGHFYFTRMHYPTDPVDEEIKRLENDNMCTVVEKKLFWDTNEEDYAYIFVISKGVVKEL